MDKTVAAAVLATAETLPKKLKVVDAEAIVRRWLRALGRPEDRHGNFALEIPEDLRQDGVVARRYHFTDRQLQKQVKYGPGPYGGRPDWYNRSSRPIIDAANELIQLAAEALGRTDVAEQVTKTKQQRTSATEKRAEEVKAKEIDLKAKNLARKYLAKKYREDVLKNYANVAIDPDRLAEMKQALEFHTEFFRGAVLGQRTMPTDDMFASIDAPPILPLFGPIEYEWVEREGGVPYSIYVANKEKNKAIVKIGSSGTLVDIDPSSLRVSGNMRRNAEGDGSIDGILLYRDNKFYGALVVISAQKKKAGVGTRLLNLWCRMMAGYGIKQWVAVAVGPEGQGFFAALEKRGRIRVDERGSNWVIRCL